MTTVAMNRGSKTTSKFVLALAGLALLAGCATVDTSQDEGQTRDRPTGGTGR